MAAAAQAFSLLRHMSCMTEKDLRRLSRADLLEMLIEQTKEMDLLKARLEKATAMLEKRDIAIDRAGSIAEAALQLNGVFEAAEAAGQQYLENIRSLSERQEAVCAERERESRAKAEKMVADAQKESERILEAAKAEAQTYWDEVSSRLDAFYREHHGLRELLSFTAANKK